VRVQWKPTVPPSKDCATYILADPLCKIIFTIARSHTVNNVLTCSGPLSCALTVPSGDVRHTAYCQPSANPSCHYLGHTSTCHSRWKNKLTENYGFFGSLLTTKQFLPNSRLVIVLSSLAHYIIREGTVLSNVLRCAKRHCFLATSQASPFVLVNATCRWRWVWSNAGLQNDLKYIQRSSPYRAVNTLRLGYKNQPVTVV
jgi:hypothetical protein